MFGFHSVKKRLLLIESDIPLLIVSLNLGFFVTDILVTYGGGFPGFLRQIRLPRREFSISKRTDRKFVGT